MQILPALADKDVPAFHREHHRIMQGDFLIDFMVVEGAGHDANSFLLTVAESLCPLFVALISIGTGAFLPLLREKS